MCVIATSAEVFLAFVLVPSDPFEHVSTGPIFLARPGTQLAALLLQVLVKSARVDEIILKAPGVMARDGPDGVGNEGTGLAGSLTVKEGSTSPTPYQQHPLGLHQG